MKAAVKYAVDAVDYLMDAAGFSNRKSLLKVIPLFALRAPRPDERAQLVNAKMSTIFSR